MAGQKTTLPECGGQAEYLTIKQISERTGLSVSTLRYYDKEGLTPQVTRSGGGLRQYTEEDVCWLELICCLKHSGMALPEIRRFMEMCGEGEEAADQRREVLLQQKELLEKQIACLQCSLDMIEYKIAHYREIGVFGARQNGDCSAPAAPEGGGSAGAGQQNGTSRRPG